MSRCPIWMQKLRNSTRIEIVKLQRSLKGDYYLRHT